MRSGALQFVPPSVLRANMTSHRFEPPPVEQSAYTFPRVALVERSTATQAWPSNPAGLMAPPSWPPPRSIHSLSPPRAPPTRCHVAPPLVDRKRSSANVFALEIPK